MTEPPADRTALYRLFDDSGTLLYVGITNDPEVRWAYHARQKAWWPEVHRRTIEWKATRAEAEAAEVEAIGRENPRWNTIRPDAEGKMLQGRRGGRPTTGQTPVVTLRVPRELREEFDAEVKASGRNRSDVLIEAMHDWLRKRRRERAAADLVARNGDPDSMCGAAHRTEHHGIARCSRGHGHPGVHTGHADDGTRYQWPERPASSEEKTT